MVFVLMASKVVLNKSPLVVEVFDFAVKFELFLALDGLVLELLLLNFVVLGDHNVDLRVKDKLLPDDLKLEFVELLDLFVVVPAHFLVLLLEERDMLEAGLFIVEETTNARLFLVLDDLFLEDLQL